MFWIRDRTSLLKTWHISGQLWNALVMWGPGVAALLTARWRPMQSQPRITLVGSSARRSWALYALPFWALAALQPPVPESAWSFALFLTGAGLANVFGEELGWRGYLQPALRPLPFVWRHVLIATLWELWHFTGRLSDPTPLWASWGVNVLLSMVMGLAVERSQSILVAVVLHCWFNLAFELPCWQTYATMACTAALGGLLLVRWPRPV